MKIYKAATALVLFAAFAYAQDENADESDDDDADDDEDEEPELIDISEMWEELQTDEDFAAWYAAAEASNDAIVTEWWGYVEDVVAVIDAAVDAQELYWDDLEDLDDFMSELTDEETEALITELAGAMDAYTTFMTSLSSNADLTTAIEDLLVLFFGNEQND